MVTVFERYPVEFSDARATLNSINVQCVSHMGNGRSPLGTHTHTHTWLTLLYNFIILSLKPPANSTSANERMSSGAVSRQLATVKITKSNSINTRLRALSQLVVFLNSACKWHSNCCGGRSLIGSNSCVHFFSSVRHYSCDP